MKYADGLDVFEVIRTGDTWMIGDKEYTCVKKAKGRVYFQEPDAYNNVSVDEVSFTKKQFEKGFADRTWHTFERAMTILDWKNRVRKLEEMVAHLQWLVVEGRI